MVDRGHRLAEMMSATGFPHCGRLARSGWYQLTDGGPCVSETAGPAAVAELGVSELHFHDLRHSGNTFSARTRASLRDLMARMGHDSSQAALIYQLATSEADQAIGRGQRARRSAEADERRRGVRQASLMAREDPKRKSVEPPSFPQARDLG
jgi:hypothetical protein